MKFFVKGHGELEIEGLTKTSLGAIRLIQYNSPDMTVNCWDGTRFLRVKLSEIDLRSSSVPPSPNADRAQLSALGGFDANGGEPVT